MFSKGKIGMPMEEEYVFTSKFPNGKILIVENQDEYDLASALQLIYGAEVQINIGSRVSLADIALTLQHVSRVFTTWDPLDSQR